MFARRHETPRLPWIALALIILLAGGTAHAEDGTTAELRVAVDTVWVVLAGGLVFFMNAGFALLETGLCRAKNAVNILAKNFTVAAIAGLVFFAVGFGLMFSDGNALVGFGGWFLGGADASPAVGEAYAGVFSSLSWAGVPLEAKFFFQACFAMTAASIVSGAVAERIKFQAFIAFSILLIAIVYPITGHWIWGGGWLARAGFWDFAGSTQVHALGGIAALTGAVMLGARRGKFGRDGKARPIPGHSIPMATLGGFILWLGWLGFNAGSTMAADPGAISHIAAATVLGSFGGIAGALAASYTRNRTFDLTLLVNGCLAGLVAITAPCAFVSLGSATAIGLVAGVIVVPAVALLDRLRIDDPVGAVSVHLFGGVWGTLALGLFAESQFSSDVGNGLFFGGGGGLIAVQAMGAAAVVGFGAVSATVFWAIVRRTLGLRVDAEEEDVGLDLSEMGMGAYATDSTVRRAVAEEPGPDAGMEGAPASELRRVEQRG